MADDANALTHAIAGCMGATAALGLFYPLDLLRTLRQSRAAAKKQSGRSGGTSKTQSELLQLPSKLSLTSLAEIPKLYHGFFSAVSTQGVSFFVYFFALRFIQQRLPNADNQKMLVATLAGAINVLITNPLWVASTAIKTRKPSKDMAPAPGMFATLSEIYSERGVAGLWKGVVVSLVLVANPAIQFAAYEWLKNAQAYLRKVDPSQLGGAEYFIFGALAKAAATLVTYPLQVAQTLLRKSGKKTPRHPDHSHSNGNFDENSTASTSTGSQQQLDLHPVFGMWRVLRQLYSTGGTSALYAGLQMKFVQSVLTSAFMFLAYEKFLRLAAFLVARFSAE